MKRALLKLEYLLFKHVPGMLTCAEADAFISDYVDGLLPAAQRRKFERHIRMCRSCRAYLKAYRRTVTLARLSAAEQRTPAATRMPEELVHAILAACR
jgi:anti-sigma factor RsiW